MITFFFFCISSAIQTGDYKIKLSEDNEYRSKLILYSGSVLIFHTKDTNLEITKNSQNGLTQIYTGTNFSQIITTTTKTIVFISLSKHCQKETFILFTVFSPERSLYCETLDVYNGFNTFFDVFAANQTINNLRRKQGEKCILFSWPYTTTYGFSVSNHRNPSNAFTLYVVKNNIIKSKYTKEVNAKTVLLKLKDDSTINAHANKTNIIINSKTNHTFDSHDDDDCEKNDINSYYPPGDYKEEMEALMTRNLTFPDRSIVVFHNPFDLSIEYGSESFIGSLHQNVFNITNKATLVVNSAVKKTVSFSVISYKGIGCKTMDVFNGYSTKLEIGSHSYNVSMKSNQNMCFIFSSPFLTKYSFHSECSNSDDKLSVYSYNGKLINTLSKFDKESYINRSFIMRWETGKGKHKGFAGLKEMEYSSSSVVEYINDIFFGSYSIVNGKYFNNYVSPLSKVISLENQTSVKPERVEEKEINEAIVREITSITVVILVFIIVLSIFTCYICLKRSKKSGNEPITDLSEFQDDFSVPQYGLPPTAPEQYSYAPTATLFYSPEAVSPENPYGIVNIVDPRIPNQFEPQGTYATGINDELIYKY